MSRQLSIFFKIHKTFIVSIGFLVLFSFTVARATPPTSPYTAGTTLNPTCAPTTTNCTVAVGTISPWTVSGNNVYYNTGNVGIGTSNPSTALEVNGTVQASTLTSTGTVNANVLNITGTSTSITIANPSNLTASIIYDPSDNYVAQNYYHNYKVYAYKNTTDGRVYSSGFATLSVPVTDNNSSNSYGVSLTWNAVLGADGYRLLIDSNDSFYSTGYVEGYDTTTNSLLDDGGSIVIFDSIHGTITPALGASNANTITGGITLGGNLDTTGNIGISGNLNTTGNITVNGTSTFRDAIVATGKFSSIGAAPNLGAGTRMEWIPSKSAFRVGTADGSEWDDASIGNYSVAFGEGATASGDYSAAFGQQSVASGINSVAFGLGSDSLAGGVAFSGGFSSGQLATAFGGTFAYGRESLTSGFGGGAFGDYSTAIGFFAWSDSYVETSFGSRNVFGRSGSNSANTWVPTEPLFEVGNTDLSIVNNTNLSDALVILKNGNTGINLKANAPTHSLDVGNSAVSGIVARFQNSTGTCDINPTSSALSCSSDMNLKKNIVNLADNSTWSFNTNITLNNQSILTKVLALNPVDYNWNTEANGSGKHDGFIAQEVQQVFPDLVSQDATTNLLSLNYTGLVPYTIEAIKEMNLNISSIDDLTKQNSWRDSLVAWLGDTGNGIRSFYSKQITSDQNTTNKLCVGTACVTQEQFLQMIQNSGQAPASSTAGTVPTNAQTLDVTPLVITTQNDSTVPSGTTQSSDVIVPSVSTN